MLRKNGELSNGKYAEVIVCPQTYVPTSAFLLPLIISKKAVIARVSLDKKIILSPLFALNSTSLNSTLPSMVALSPLTSSILSPALRSGLKIIPGYLRVDACMSSTFSFSSIFLRLVACFDFFTLALNREINSCNSFFLSSAFLFAFCCCLKAS